MKPESFLVALLLADKRCVVVGAGAEAVRRARALLAAGADVLVLGDAPDPELEQLALAGELRLDRRAPTGADLDSAWLVVLTERDPALAQSLADECARRRLFFCAVDQPGQNGFHHVALARRGPVTLAVATEGVAPALAKRLRDELEDKVLTPEFAEFVHHMAELRARLPAERRKEVLTREAARVELGRVTLAPREHESGP
ncbi:MAG: NAD(P)-dependent oxidoreductase [Polyangiaceae bacterium]